MGERSEIILIVDDEEAVRNACKRLLVRGGFQVDIATDGEHALAMLEKDPRRYAVVLVDQTMPGMSGVDTILKMRERAVEVPAVLMSGCEIPDAHARFGAYDLPQFLPKPFDTNNLYTAVERALHRATH